MYFTHLQRQSLWLINFVLIYRAYSISSVLVCQNQDLKLNKNADNICYSPGSRGVKHNPLLEITLCFLKVNGYIM